MSDHYRIDGDRDKTLFCMIPVVTIDWNEQGEIYNTEPCNKPMWVEWTFVTTLGQQVEVHRRDAADWADSDGWEIKCENGHVLATSSNFHSTDDHAEDFKAWMIFPRLPIEPVPWA